MELNLTSTPLVLFIYLSIYDQKDFNFFWIITSEPICNNGGWELNEKLLKGQLRYLMVSLFQKYWITLFLKNLKLMRPNLQVLLLQYYTCMFMSMGYITHVKFTVVLFNINTTFMLNTIKNSNCQFLFETF